MIVYFQMTNNFSLFIYYMIILYCICVILIICLVVLLICKLKKNKIKYVENFNGNNKIDKYLVISLDNDTGRKKWQSMRKTILGNKLTKFKGINGKEIDIDDYEYKNIIKRDWDYGTWKYNKRDIVEMSDGEVGCCLSHFYLWNKIIEEDYHITLVLEDDALRYNKEFINLTEHILQYAPNNWDIILLGFMIPHKARKNEKKIGNFYKVNQFFLTHSYLISLNGAKKLSHKTPINAPIDTWMSMQSNSINIYRHDYIVTTKNLIKSNLVAQSDSISKSEIEHSNHAF